MKRKGAKRKFTPEQGFDQTSTQNNLMCSKCIQDVESRKNLMSRKVKASEKE